MGVTSDELNLLRAQLPEFGRGVVTPALQRYLDFYELDFSASYPDASYRFGRVPSGTFQLMTQCWLLPDARANLLLVHGYFDHTGLYEKLIEYGLSRRCNVLIFDLPGHGLSSGDPAVIESFSDYADAIEGVLRCVQLPDLPLLAMAQSTGCSALVEYARLYEWDFDRVVLLAPLVRPAGWTAVRVGYLLLHRFTDRVARKFNRNSADEVFLAFVRDDPLQSGSVSLSWIGALRRWLRSLPVADLGVGPVQVVQGRRDTTVDWRYNVKAVVRLFPGSQVEYLPEAGHQLANESSPIRATYYALLDRYFFA